MALELIAQGTNIYDLRDSADIYEEQIPPGSEAELQIGTRVEVPQTLLDTIQWGLQQAGVHLSRPVRWEDGVVKIQWRKTLNVSASMPGLRAFPLVLAAIIGVIIALLLALIIFWKLYNVVPEPFRSVLIIGLSILGILAITGDLMKRAKGLKEEFRKGFR